MKRRHLALTRWVSAAAATATMGFFAVAGTAAPSVPAAFSAIRPAVTNDFHFLTSDQTPPSEDQCYSVDRRCFSPDAMRNSYNLGPLYDQGYDGTGMTIAVVDSFGSDTIANDLNVFDTEFGLPHLCGEPGVQCTKDMPTFTIIKNKGQHSHETGNGHQQDRSAWSIEVSLDVEWAHAIAPGANIVLVTTPVAETLGVQGMPAFMKAEDDLITKGEADVISQSFASTEQAFHSTQSLMNLRYAFEDAQAAGVTMLASSGDFGSEGILKSPVGQGGTELPFPAVWWPASDPLVTGVGGTYLCTDGPTGTTVDNVNPPVNCQVDPPDREIGWIAGGGGFSVDFARPSFQDELPPGSTPIPSTSRGVPDISYQASSRTGVLVYDSLFGDDGLICPDGNPCSPGWYVVGGTSSGSPQWAGLVAIADQIHGGRIGYLNPLLYELALDPAKYAADFYDPTQGTNQLDPNVEGYVASPGWDPVTGLGTPNAANLLPDLASMAP